MSGINKKRTESQKRRPGTQEGTVTRKDRGRRRLNSKQRDLRSPSHPQITPRDGKQEEIKKSWISSLLPDVLHAKSTDLKINLECQRFKPNQSRGKPRKGYPGSFWNYTDGPGQHFNSRFSTAVPKQYGILSQGTKWTGKLRDLPRERLNQAAFL